MSDEITGCLDHGHFNYSCATCVLVRERRQSKIMQDFIEELAAEPPQDEWDGRALQARAATVLQDVRRTK